MTLSELQKMIDEEVAVVINATTSEAETMREPSFEKPKPIYRPALKNEDEIDNYLFFAGKKPKI